LRCLRRPAKPGRSRPSYGRAKLADFSKALAFEKYSALLDVAKKINTALKGLGASALERDTLIGICGCESAFDDAAVGPGGELGLWQIESEHLPIVEQATNALRACQSYESEFPALNREYVKDVIRTDPTAYKMLIRTTWQRGKKAAGSIGRWADSVYTAMRTIMQSKDWKDVATAWKGAIAEMTKDGKIGLPEYIDFAVGEGADRAALERGAAGFETFMNAYQWSPLITLEKIGSSGPGFGDQVKAAWDETVDIGKSGVASLVHGAFSAAREGVKAFGGEALRTLVPAALIVAGGIGGYHLLKWLWHKTDSSKAVAHE